MFRYHLHTISLNYMTMTFQIFKLSSNQKIGSFHWDERWLFLWLMNFMSNLFILLLLMNINSTYVDFFNIVINKFYLLCQIFYLLSYVPEFFFLSYSFVMFRIDFLLSIWVNLHIYINIVFVGLVFGLKCLLIILYCIWQMKHLYFFEEKSKLYLVCYI